MKLLVTSGATREPIDAVRYVSNLGTGATGAALADALQTRGHAVTLLCGEGAAAPRGVRDVERFSSAENLATRLRLRLAAGDYTGVVMTAAVADYRPAEIAPGKIGSEPERLVLTLVRNPKILPQIKSFSPRPLAVVGFKLTAGADDTARRSAVAAQFAAGGVDLVVHNDVEEIRRAPAHPFWLYTGPDAASKKIDGAEALAAALVPFLARLSAGRG